MSLKDGSKGSDLASRLGAGSKKQKKQDPPSKPKSGASLSERLGTKPSRKQSPVESGGHVPPSKKGVSFDSFIKRDKAEAEKKRTEHKKSSKSPQPQQPANSLAARLGSGSTTSKPRPDSVPKAPVPAKSKSRSPPRKPSTQKDTKSQSRSPPRGPAAERSSSPPRGPKRMPGRRSDAPSVAPAAPPPPRSNSHTPDPDRYYRGTAYSRSDNYYRPSQSASRFRSTHNTSPPASTAAPLGPSTAGSYFPPSSQYGPSNDFYGHTGYVPPPPPPQPKNTNAATTYDPTNSLYYRPNYSATPPPPPPQSLPQVQAPPQTQTQPVKHGRDESAEAPERTKRRRLKIRGVGTPTTVKITYLDVETTEGDLREILRQLGFENITSCMVSPVYDELDPKYSTATVGFKNREDASACVKELDGVEADDSGAPLVAEIVESEPAQQSHQDAQPSSLLDQLIKHRMAKVEQDDEVKYIKGRGFH